MDSVNVSLLQIEMWCGGKVTAVPFCGDTSRVLRARPTRSPGTSQRRRHSVCTLRSERKISDLEVSFNLAKEVECWDSWVHYFADGSQKNNNHLHEIGIRKKQSGVLREERGSSSNRGGWSQGGGGAGGRVLLCLSMMLTYRRGRQPKVPNKQPKNDLFITKQCKTGVTAKTNRDDGPAGRPGIMGCRTWRNFNHVFATIQLPPKIC